MKKLRNDELNRLTVGEFRKAEKAPIVVILDNIRSFNNVGSAFRTADAFRLKAIYLCGITAKPPHREIHKTALGATDSVTWKYFKNTEELTFLPFRKSSKIEKRQQGINTHQHYQIPIKAVAVGRLNLPNIAVQYFNPETGLIEKTSISIPVVMVINHWLLAILGFALLLLLAFVWLKAISRVKGILKRRTQIKQALQALKSANSYSKIQSALMQYALAKKGKNNISLGQFVKSCDLNKKDQLALEALIEKLQLSEFSLRENKQSTKIAADLFEILH